MEIKETNNLKIKKEYKDDFFKNINDLKSSSNSINWFLFILLIVIIFKNDVNVTNEVELKKETYSKDYSKEPETYCSEDGILYWINGYTETSSTPRYILSVVYDNTQKPKKCTKKDN